MKYIKELRKKISAVILAAAVAVAVPFAALSLDKGSPVLADAGNYFFDTLDSVTAFLVLYGEDIPNDVRCSLESSRSQAVATIDDTDGYVAAYANMRVALRVAESTYAGIPVDTNVAPDPVLGTAEYNQMYGITSDAARTTAAIYATSRGLPTEMIRTALKNSFVERLYPIILGRTCDIAGRDYWVNSIESGLYTPADAVRTMLNSAEFVGRNTSNQEFVTVLYNAFLSRNPDPSGLANWVNALNNGASRNDIINAFAQAPEFAATCSYYGM